MENDHSDLKNPSILEEMENIIEWVDQHPNARLQLFLIILEKAVSAIPVGLKCETRHSC
jgi:hypothetical protein